MSTQSRRAVGRARKSLIRNSPLFTPSTANKKLTNSLAFEFESEPINSSLSSVFTDNEAVFTETKKAGRPKKIRKTQDLRDCYEETGSADSMDRNTTLQVGGTKSSKVLTKILVSASRSRKKKKPLFTLPNDIFQSNRNTDTEDETIKNKAKSKKKIRYTQDLNAISNDTMDSAKAVKVKSKKTKKAKLPSFLPPVDMIDEIKKLSGPNPAESLIADSDNKENDTNTTSTDTEEYIRTRLRRRPRKAKKRLPKNGDTVAPDNREETIPNKSPSKAKFVFKNNLDDNTKTKNTNFDQSKHSQSRHNLSVDGNSSKESIVNNNIQSGDVHTESIGEPVESLSKKDGFINSISMNISGDIGKSMINNTPEQETKQLLMNTRNSKCNTFNAINSPTKSHRTNNSRNSEISLDQNELLTAQNKLKRNTLTSSGQTMLNTPNKSGNTSDFDKQTMHSSLEISQTFNETPALKNTSEQDAQSRQSTGSRTPNLTVNLEILDTVSEPNIGTTSLRSSMRSLTFDMPSNLENDTSLIKSTRSTRNRKSNSTRKSVSNLEPTSTTCELNTNEPFLKGSKKRSNAIDKRSTLELTSGLELSKNISKSNAPLSKRITSDVESSSGKTSQSERNSSFKNHSINSKDQLEQHTDKKSIRSKVSKRATYDIVPPGQFAGSSDVTDNTVIDLTESPMEESRLSKKSPRSDLDKRKSSFEVSFQAKKNRKISNEILDHLNITRRESKKSSFKNSFTGPKYSTGSDSEDTKPKSNFVTLRRRRECHTMIDFDTGDSLDDSSSRSGRGALKRFKNVENLDRNGTGDNIVLSNKNSPEAIDSFCIKNACANEPAPRTNDLKKSVGTTKRDIKRDTYEIAEYFYESLENQKKAKPTVTVIGEATPNVTLEHQSRIDIFDLVTRTPTVELGKMLIGSGESVIVDRSFLNDTNRSPMPKLTRMSTFTKSKDGEKTPLPVRKSTRKRWSQVERTPIFDSVPKVNDSSFAPDQPTDTTLKMAANQSKSVTIKTPPDFTPRKRWNDSLRTKPRQAKAAEKEKKSVKIETPAKTPKIRLHSPLVMRKTPGLATGGADDSILTSNCAYYCLPTKTSTPFSKKGEVSLLKKVLTNDKNKSEKSIGKNSVKAKMPNFAKIHQRQFEKMENLKEMHERKAIRAQYLLSGSKPPTNTSASSIFEKESRKKLKFSPQKAEPLKIDVNTSGLKVGKTNSKIVSKPIQHMLNKRASLEKKKKGIESMLLLNKRTSLEKKKKEIKSMLPIAVAKPIVVSKADPKASSKPEPKGFTRFGFRLPPGKAIVTKDEQIKAVTTKSKIAGNRTETNRKQLGGVRSNRRFDLLMKMRENKK